LITTVHPTAIHPLRKAESVVDEETARDIFVYVTLFSSLFTFSTVLIYLDTVRTGLDASTLEDECHYRDARETSVRDSASWGR